MIIILYIILLAIFALIMALILRYTFKFSYLSPNFKFAVAGFSLIALVIIGISVSFLMRLDGPSSLVPSSHTDDLNF